MVRIFPFQAVIRGVGARSGVPALYLYRQTFSMDGGSRTRTALVGMMGLEPYGEKVLPHEDTLSAGVSNRMNRLKESRTHDNPVFLLYRDPAGEVRDLLVPAGEPLATVPDDNGLLHEIWEFGDPDRIERVRELLADREVTIADGHHRYDAALRLLREMEGRESFDGAESFGNILAGFVALEDPGLTILPTHRLVYNVDRFDPGEIRGRLKERFEVRRISTPPGGAPRESVERLLAEMKRTEPRHSFGMVLAGDPDLYLFFLPEGEDPTETVSGEHSLAWKELDVSILHRLVFEPILGIGERELEDHSHVEYVRDAAEGIARVRSGKFQGAFLLNPTPVEQVREVAAAGDRMPPKSTDFYPKLLPGLVSCRLKGEETQQSKPIETKLTEGESK